MNIKSIGFIGGGRITKIFLEALKRNNKLKSDILVSDINSEVLKKLKERFASIEIFENDFSKTASADLVIISLHPPVFLETLGKISSFIKKDAIVISLAPKIKILKIAEIIKSSSKIIRMIPNAPSIIGEGFNPVVFSNDFKDYEKKELLNFFSNFGESVFVKEEMLEAYAIISAMGPTYFWYQLYELKDLAITFGFTKSEAEKAIEKMMTGALKTMNENFFTPVEVMDLVPVKPLADIEESVRTSYKNKLSELYVKLKS